MKLIVALAAILSSAVLTVPTVTQAGTAEPVALALAFEKAAQRA
jgi:hypothetical protein